MREVPSFRTASLSRLGLENPTRFLQWYRFSVLHLPEHESTYPRICVLTTLGTDSRGSMFAPPHRCGLPI